MGSWVEFRGWLSVNQGFDKLLRKINGRIGAILKWMGFVEAAFVFWVRTRDPEWAEQQEAEGRKQHGSGTRGVSVGHVICILPHTGHLHGPCKRENGLHGSSTRGVSVRRDIFILPHTGRAAQHGPCCSFGSHGSQKASARGVFVILATRGVQIDTGRPWIYTGRVIFFFWGRKPNLFSVFRVYYDLRILIGLIRESY